MSYEPVSGSTLACSASAPATYDDTGYGALSFTAIGEITDIGTDYGRIYVPAAHSPVGDRKGAKKKAGYNLSDVKLWMAWDQSDAGQDLLRTAELDDSVLAFKLVKQGGDIRYFSAQVSEFVEVMGTEDNVDAGSVVLLMQRNLVEAVPPPPVYATWDAANKSARITLSGGDLIATSDGTSNNQAAKANVYKSSGILYNEFPITTLGYNGEVGIANAAAPVDVTGLGNDVNGYGYLGSSGYTVHNGIAVAYGSTFGDGDKVSMVLNFTAGTLSFWVNGIDQGVAYTGISESWTIAMGAYATATVITLSAGASAWDYTPPVGGGGWTV